MAYPQDRNSAYQNLPPSGYPAPGGFGGQPPAAGYPPQQPQYPPQSGGYPPQQPYPQQYPPPQFQQYPPQHYPPPQQYPIQGYPPQQFPRSQTGGYNPPPLSPNFPPRNVNSYPPQPQTQHFAQQPQHQASFHSGPPQQYQQPPPPIYHTSPPIAPPIVPTADIDIIYRACKGFGTDENAIIKVLAFRDGPTINAIREQYPIHTKRDLIATLEKETSGNFRTVLKAVAFGPIECEVFFANLAVAGLGTNEALLTECIMGKSNTEINEMKRLYPGRYRETLENAVDGDLSMKTQKMFMMMLSGVRMEEQAQINTQAVLGDTAALHKATRGFGTDDLAICTIFTRSSDAHLRAVAAEYQRQHGAELTKLIRREFSGHMHDALLYIINGALNRVARDVELLEDSMKGFGTRDELLISRLVRARWNKPHFDQVKQMYRTKYGKELGLRVKGETSGDYGRMMVALCE